jgi:phosphomevalonate kinase
MRKNSLGLLLAAAAAYGAYRYNKMTPEQKTNLRTRGKDFLNKNLGGLNDMFNKKKTTVNGNGY